jgi:hypothetical protein
MRFMLNFQATWLYLPNEGGHRRTASWRWTQSLSNPSPASNSLLTGKNTGKSTNTGRFGPHPCLKKAFAMGVFLRNSLSNRTGNLENRNRESIFDSREFRNCGPIRTEPPSSVICHDANGLPTLCKGALTPRRVLHWLTGYGGSLQAKSPLGRLVPPRLGC